MFNVYKTARTMPMTKAALMFEAQQQGIFENLWEKMEIRIRYIRDIFLNHQYF